MSMLAGMLGGRSGRPMYKRWTEHVVRFFHDGQYLTIRSLRTFPAIKKSIKEKYGAKAAASAVSWGWQ